MLGGRGGGATSLDTPSVDVKPDQNLMVIYTSGTTGLPKGINNDHMKLLVIGATVAARMGRLRGCPRGLPAQRAARAARSLTGPFGYHFEPAGYGTVV